MPEASFTGAATDALTACCRFGNNASMEAVHPLTAYRNLHKLKPADLARLLGVSRATVHRWETGERKPSRDKLPVIKEKTGIQPGAILDYEAAQ